MGFANTIHAGHKVDSLAPPPESSRMPVTSPTRARIRWFVTLALLGLIILVSLQNIDETTVSVLFWTFRMPLIIVIILSYGIGLIVGWLWWPFVRSEARED